MTMCFGNSWDLPVAFNIWSELRCFPPIVVKLFRKVKWSGPADAHTQFCKDSQSDLTANLAPPAPASLFMWRKLFGSSQLFENAKLCSSEFQSTEQSSKTSSSTTFDGTCGVKAIVLKCWCRHVLSESQKQPSRGRPRAICVSLLDKLDVRAVSAYILVQKATWSYFSFKFDWGGILQVSQQLHCQGEIVRRCILEITGF